MDFLTGKGIFDASLALDVGLGQIDAAISGISDELERKAWAARLGSVLRAINEELIIPIITLYPELDVE